MKRNFIFLVIFILLLLLTPTVALANPQSAKISMSSSDTFEANQQATNITGTVLNADTSAIMPVTVTIKVAKDLNVDGILDSNETVDENIVATVNSSSGSFSIPVLIDEIGQFIIYGVSDETTSFNIDDANNRTYQIYRVIPAITLQDEDMMTIIDPGSSQVVIQGTFINGDGSSLSTQNLTLNYIDNKNMGSKIAEANFLDSNGFGFLVNGNLFNDYGKIGLYYNGVLIKEGIVAKQPDVAFEEYPNTYQDEKNITLNISVENMLSIDNKINCYLNGTKNVLNLNDEGKCSWDLELKDGINYLSVVYGEETKYQNRYSPIVYYNVEHIELDYEYNNDLGKYSGRVRLRKYKNNQPYSNELTAELYEVQYDSTSPTLIDTKTLTLENGVYLSDYFETEKGKRYYIKFYNQGELIDYSVVTAYPGVQLITEPFTNNNSITINGFLAFYEGYTKIEYSLNNGEYIELSNIDENGNFEMTLENLNEHNYVNMRIHIEESRYGSGFSIYYETPNINIEWTEPNGSMGNNQNIVLKGNVNNALESLQHVVITINGQSQQVALVNGEYSLDVTLDNGINFVQIEYKDDNNVYTEVNRRLYYNLVSNYVEYIYDNSNNIFSGDLVIVLNENKIQNESDNIRGEIYRINSKQLTYDSEVLFSKDDNYFKANFTPSNKGEYYIKYFENETVLGYSVIDCYSQVVLHNYNYNENPADISGFLAFANGASAVKLSFNGGDYELAENLDSNGNFSITKNLNSGFNNINAKIIIDGNEYNSCSFGVYSNSVIEDLNIVTESIPNVVAGLEYSFTLEATGGVAPYTWQCVYPLPAGLTFDNGTISGVTNIVSPYTLRFDVRDSENNQVAKEYTLIVENINIDPTIELASKVAVPNLETDIEVTLKDAIGVSALQFEIRFNKNIVEFKGFELNNQLNNWVASYHEVSAGVVRIVAVGDSNISESDFNLGVFKFLPKGEIGQSTSIVIKSPLATNSSLLEITPKVKHGKIDIFIKYGDVNGDKNVNIIDVVRLMSHANNTNLLNDEEFMAGDVNGDHQVNNLDIDLVMSHIIKSISSFPVQS